MDEPRDRRTYVVIDGFRYEVKEIDVLLKAGAVGFGALALILLWLTHLK